MKKILVFMVFLVCSIITFSEETKEEYLSGKIIALVSEENSDEEGVAKITKI